jgi:hypothetical protein
VFDVKFHNLEKYFDGVSRKGMNFEEFKSRRLHENYAVET